MKTSVVISMLVLFSSIVASAVISLKYDYMYKVADPFEAFDFLYDKPWLRVGPYLMGELEKLDIFFLQWFRGEFRLFRNDRRLHSVEMDKSSQNLHPFERVPVDHLYHCAVLVGFWHMGRSVVDPKDCDLCECWTRGLGTDADVDGDVLLLGNGTANQ